jgi:hypothetical protein
MLYPLHASGIMAFCSDLIVNPNEQEIAYFLSVSGYQTAVKGIIANFLEHNSLRLEFENKHHYVERSYLNYTYQMKKLPSGLVHAVVFPNLALNRNDEQKQNSFFIFTQEPDDIPTLFYRHLDDLTDIPLHQSWTSWLWDFFKNTDGWLVGLETIVGSYHGYMIEFNALMLQESITEAIHNQVPEILSCMERS